MIIKNGDGVKGALLQTRRDGSYVFRVYAEDRKSFTDYELRAEDISVTLRGNYNCLVEDESGNYIGYRLCAERRAGKWSPPAE